MMQFKFMQMMLQICIDYMQIIFDADDVIVHSESPGMATDTFLFLLTASCSLVIIATTEILKRKCFITHTHCTFVHN